MKNVMDAHIISGEIDNCMFGEEDVPNNMKKKCEVSDELPV